jgi:predicted 3-demethylubiquinone-9 3-methyltransferase (glyoxalase superfamily)
MFSGNAEETTNSYISFKEGTVLHEFTFTPAMSLYVRCDSQEEIDKLYDKLSQDGKVYMPLSSYPFSERFAWIEDKYGVSWQLSLEKSRYEKYNR